MAFVYGFLTSLQYTSMNTLAYADVNAREASGASTIASTVQQMAVSFGVAAASLAAALFIPDRVHATAPQMIHGIHLALLGARRIDHRVDHRLQRTQSRRRRCGQPAQGGAAERVIRRRLLLGRRGGPIPL